jgi:hypothetical protein
LILPVAVREVVGKVIVCVTWEDAALPCCVGGGVMWVPVWDAWKGYPGIFTAPPLADVICVIMALNIVTIWFIFWSMACLHGSFVDPMAGAGGGRFGGLYP